MRVRRGPNSKQKRQSNSRHGQFPAISTHFQNAGPPSVSGVGHRLAQVHLRLPSQMRQQSHDGRLFPDQEGQLLRRRYGAHQSNAQPAQSLQRRAKQQNQNVAGIHRLFNLIDGLPELIIDLRLTGRR